MLLRLHKVKCYVEVIFRFTILGFKRKEVNVAI